MMAVASAAELRPNTLSAYEEYWRRIDNELRTRPNFLVADAKGGRERMRLGEVLIFERRDRKEPPDGLIHHWDGAVFIPGVNVKQVLDLVQNYDRHKNIYAPEVVDSQTLSRNGNDFQIRLRLLKKKIVTAVLETEHHVRYRKVTDRKWESVSRSTKIAEVDGAGSGHETQSAPGTGHGFCWRLDSFWRFEEADGGVYVECTSVSLSRDIPFGMSRLIRPIINDLPETSLRNVLTQTKRALSN
ncbi:MAG: hypothetical protein JNL98_01065 [Bryobacterales bacterium]|nr:hypothetical protein [Bryobacterales bacterium]